MFKTIIDFEVIEQFFSKDKPDITDDINAEIWISFKKFIKQECFLEIVNYHKSLYSIFINELTTGLGDADFIIQQGFKEPYKCEIKDFNPYTFFCLAEKLEEKKRNYEKKNGLLFAFEDDYLNIKWQRLSLFNKPKNLPVRKDYSGRIFKSWDELNGYLLPFTDVVIADNYLLSDDSFVESNLKPILLQLDKKALVKYNLTIVINECKKYKQDGEKEKEYERLLSFKHEKSLKCNLSLVINKGYDLKEHDRGIFMNYLRIYSGDSFNYFNSKNEIITKGTDIQFQSMASPDNFNTAKAALENLSAIVKNTQEKYRSTNTFGTFKNRLLNIGML